MYKGYITSFIPTRDPPCKKFLADFWGWISVGSLPEQMLRWRYRWPSPALKEVLSGHRQADSMLLRPVVVSRGMMNISWVYKGWTTTQLYRDYNQPTFFWFYPEKLGEMIPNLTVSYFVQMGWWKPPISSDWWDVCGKGFDALLLPCDNGRQGWCIFLLRS